jgi:hypothetical protein
LPADDQTRRDIAANSYTYLELSSDDNGWCGPLGERTITPFRSVAIPQHGPALTHPNTGATGPKRPCSKFPGKGLLVDLYSTWQATYPTYDRLRRTECSAPSSPC